MPAPPPFVMPPLQFAGQNQTPQQLAGIGKSLGQVGNQFMNQPAQPVAPGAAIPGAVGPTSAGGPQGPTPLQQPTGLQSVLNSMSPPQILNWLKTTSSPQVAQTILPQPQGQTVPDATQAGLGQGLFNGAGMLG